ncbi:MAG: OmpA family protein, partial [Steroidobacteraceae bacterium]
PPPPPPPPPPPATPPPPAAPRTITLEGVSFEYNSASLTAASKPVLDKVAEGLREHPRLRIEVQGHTDSTGSADYNLTLSQRRALSVRDYLVSQQVPADELIAKGYGKTQPIASNSTPDGRARNRRVVLVVLDNPSDVPVKDAGEAADTQ